MEKWVNLEYLILAIKNFNLFIQSWPRFSKQGQYRVRRTNEKSGPAFYFWRRTITLNCPAWRQGCVRIFFRFRFNVISTNLSYYKIIDKLCLFTQFRFFIIFLNAGHLPRRLFGMPTILILHQLSFSLKDDVITNIFVSLSFWAKNRFFTSSIKTDTDAHM